MITATRYSTTGQLLSIAIGIIDCYRHMLLSDLFLRLFILRANQEFVSPTRVLPCGSAAPYSMLALGVTHTPYKGVRTDSLDGF